MAAIEDQYKTGLCLLHSMSGPVPEVIMNFSTSSAAPSNNSPWQCLDRRPEETRGKRKKKGPKGVPGQKKIKHSGPSVSQRSPLDVDDPCNGRSVRLFGRTTNTPIKSLESGSINLRLEAGDISIDDAEFRRSAISAFEQFCESVITVDELNNPINDRSEFVERVRSKAYVLFRNTGYVLVVAFTIVAICTFLNQFQDHVKPHAPKHIQVQNDALALVLALLYANLFTIAVVYVAAPYISMFSRVLTNLVTAIVDAYEKKVASGSDDNATERFLKKYNRMKSLHHRLKTFRLSGYVTRPPKCPFCESSMSTIGVRNDRIEGNPKREVTLEEKSNLPCGDQNDISFYFESHEINWRNLEKAIAKTEEWLDRAEKQMQLIRNDSSGTADGL